jgi:hypothetical protein
MTMTEPVPLSVVPQQFPLIPKSANTGGFCVTFSRCRMMNRRIFSVREVVTMVTLDPE